MNRKRNRRYLRTTRGKRIWKIPVGIFLIIMGIISIICKVYIDGGDIIEIAMNTMFSLVPIVGGVILLFGARKGYTDRKYQENVLAENERIATAFLAKYNIVIPKTPTKDFDWTYGYVYDTANYVKMGRDLELRSDKFTSCVIRYKEESFECFYTTFSTVNEYCLQFTEEIYYEDIKDCKACKRNYTHGKFKVDYDEMVVYTHHGKQLTFPIYDRKSVASIFSAITGKIKK